MITLVNMAYNMKRLAPAWGEMGARLRGNGRPLGGKWAPKPPTAPENGAKMAAKSAKTATQTPRIAHPRLIRVFSEVSRSIASVAGEGDRSAAPG